MIKIIIAIPLLIIGVSIAVYAFCNGNTGIYESKEDE